MKKIFPLLVLVGMALPSVWAQTPETRDPEIGSRLSFGLDYKLAKGVHLTLNEELRVDDNLRDFNRFHTTVALSCKVHDNVKLRIGYALINPYSSSANAFGIRHRLMLDAVGQLRWGDWRFSLKERLQGTYRMGDMNTYQEPRMVLTLKSRLMAKYKGFGRVEPFAYLELRHVLNAYTVSAYAIGDGTTSGTVYCLDTEGTVLGDPGWFISGSNGGYLNRLRVGFGMDYNWDRHNGITVELLLDYLRDKVIDANSEGTKLKSYTIRTGFMGQLCVGYTYSF